MKKEKDQCAGLPDNHPWLMAKRMVRESVGKLPTPLVLIFVLSLALSVLASALLLLARPKAHPYEYLPLRLTPRAESVIFSAKRLQGTWKARVSKYPMTLQFKDSMFEWVVQEDGEPNLRYFARGNFKLEQDILILAQRPDIGRPYDPKNRYLVYLPLSLKNINVYSTLQKDALSFSVPQEERKILSSQFLRFLPTNVNEPLLWVKQP